MDSDFEPKLISLLSRLLSAHETDDNGLEWVPLVGQVISLVRSMDPESQPKPESKLMSLVNETISFFNSMDLDSQPEWFRSLISCATQLVNSIDSDSVPEQKQYSEFMSIYLNVCFWRQEPELVSRIHQILYLVIPMNLKWRKLISLSPQVEVLFKNGKFSVEEEIVPEGGTAGKWDKITSKGEEATHFHCCGCHGHFHEEHEKAPVQITHPLHPKHPLRLAYTMLDRRTRECFCCDENLKEVFYYCSVCDFAMNIACMEKQPELTIDHPKWHEHTLALFPRLVPLTCNLCSLADSSFSIYMCHQLCDFFVHGRCINLPRVIRISRHLHRISFVPSFNQGDLFCGVCRTKIDNDYGGYSCINDNCSYVVHSRCATQKNVWDGVELEGVPEEIEEVLQPYVPMSHGFILHFSHLNHHLKLDDNTDIDNYNEDKQCQACIMPIYSGNFYSCVQCDFILHEDCANLSRKIYHPIHPHLLTLVRKYDGVMDYGKGLCSSCGLACTSGFFYKCSEDGCEFKLDVLCATTLEPLVHGSHKHPLFLTSKPGDRRSCSVCKRSPYYYTETFNCIRGDCEFALCFRCATIPQKVRYKHDKHILTLSYGEETSVETYWCELCEGKLNPKERFYKCDVYPCVTTLHVECLIGEDLYMNPGSSWLYNRKKVTVLPNNQHMYRPICSYCKMRCPHNKVFQCSGLICCSLDCIYNSKYA